MVLIKIGCPEMPISRTYTYESKYIIHISSMYQLTIDNWYWGGQESHCNDHTTNKYNWQFYRQSCLLFLTTDEWFNRKSFSSPYDLSTYLSECVKMFLTLHSTPICLIVKFINWLAVVLALARLNTIELLCVTDL